MGQDGTVGANHAAVRIIANHTPLHVQAYFAYDAHKSGGVTLSHLRIAHAPIRAPYEIQVRRRSLPLCPVVRLSSFSVNRNTPST